MVGVSHDSDRVMHGSNQMSDRCNDNWQGNSIVSL